MSEFNKQNIKYNYLEIYNQRKKKQIKVLNAIVPKEQN